tara:strand:- start:39 stop:689 length:651 start_codon:yes stop_codon:yes gene_type:complete
MSIKYNKIFVIGFNKTATTTFAAFFKAHNLSASHQCVGSNNQWRTDKKTFQCFSDNGDAQNLEELYKEFPESLFILNVRPLEPWLISRFKHGATRSTKPNWAYPCDIDKCNLFFKNKESHHLKVLSFFEKDPNNLLIVDIQREDWQEFVSTHLSLNKKDVGSKYKTGGRGKNHTDDILKTLEIFFKKNPSIDRNGLVLNNKKTELKYLNIYKNNII